VRTFLDADGDVVDVFKVVRIAAMFLSDGTQICEFAVRLSSGARAKYDGHQPSARREASFSILSP
jgi:hypothetical protein